MAQKKSKQSANDLTEDFTIASSLIAAECDDDEDAELIDEDVDCFASDTDKSVSLDMTSLANSTARKSRRARIHQRHHPQYHHTNKKLQFRLKKKCVELERLARRHEHVRSEYAERLAELQRDQHMSEQHMHFESEQRRQLEHTLKLELERKCSQLEGRQRELERENHRLIEDSVQWWRNELQRGGGDFWKKPLLPSTSSSSGGRAAGGAGNDQHSLRTFVQSHVYEHGIRPLQEELRRVRDEYDRVNEERNVQWEDARELRARLESEIELHQALQADYRRVLVELDQKKRDLQRDDYRIEQFDSVRDERDKCQGELERARQQLEALTEAKRVADVDRSDLEKQRSTLTQANTLLEQDKQYLSGKLGDLTRKCGQAEDRLQTAWRQVEDANLNREQAVERLMQQADQTREDGERRLASELDALRLKTDSEVERIRQGVEQVHKRELQLAREEREAAVRERNTALEQKHDADTELAELKKEYDRLRVDSEDKLSELARELKIRAYENERMTIGGDEMKLRLSQVELQLEKATETRELVTREYYQLETSAAKQTNELRVKLEACQRKLDSYERLEGELDELVLHSSAATNSNGGAGSTSTALLHQFLLPANEHDLMAPPHTHPTASNGAATTAAFLPCKASRRLKQSLDLARRAMQLERELGDAKAKLAVTEAEAAKLRDRLASAEQLASDSKQPQQYLIGVVKQRDAQLAALRQEVEKLRADLADTLTERDRIAAEKNRMTLDFERLLNREDEMQMMRKMLEAMAADKHGSSDVKQAAQQGSRNQKHVDSNFSPRPTQPNRFELPKYGIEYS